MNRVDFPVVNHIEIRDGQARVVGRNLKVKMVISRLIHGTGASIEEVMDQYDLSRSEVLACLEYYYDHREAIDLVFEMEEQELAKAALSSHDWKAKADGRRKQGKSG